MAVIRRHHTVPNFYLKGFASAEARPKIGAAKLDDGQRLVLPTGDATVWKNFYSLEGHPDGADVFEKELSQLEGAASVAIRKAVEGTWPLPPEDREILGTFLAFQFLRGPNTRAWMDQTHSGLAGTVIASLGKEGLRRQFNRIGKPVTEDVLNRLLEQASEPEGLTLRTTPSGHIRHILELVPELMPYFIGRPWFLYRFNRKTLLTCDTPVSLVPDPELVDVYSGVGVGTAWGISFPLTRTIGLLLASPQPLIEEAADHKALKAIGESVAAGKSDGERDPSTAMAKLFNSHTMWNARKWIFHHPDDTGLVPHNLPYPREKEVEFDVPTWRS